MTNLQLNLTPRQLEVYKVIQKNNMAWFALIVIFGLFTIGFGSFLYAIFFIPSQGVSKSILGGIDVLLGWSIKAIISNLFSTPPATE